MTYNGLLKIAQSNAEALNAEVMFRQVDALKEDAWMIPELNKKLDVIVSNPPYVTRSEMKTIASEAARFEPHLALIGEDDGLEFYKVFASRGTQLLKPGGWIFVEIGFEQGPVVEEIFLKAGYTEVEILKDYGKNDRVIKAQAPHAPRA